MTSPRGLSQRPRRVAWSQTFFPVLKQPLNLVFDFLSATNSKAAIIPNWRTSPTMGCYLRGSRTSAKRWVFAAIDSRLNRPSALRPSSRSSTAIPAAAASGLPP